MHLSEHFNWFRRLRHVSDDVPGRGHRVAIASIAAYYVGSALVLLGIIFSAEFVETQQEHPSALRRSFLDGLVAWDGQWYARIAREGYSYDNARPSSVAFFPLYPLLAALVGQAVAAPVEIALVIVSNLFLVAALLLAVRYSTSRCGVTSNVAPESLLIAMLYFPTTFYFRMGYSESTLFFLVIGSLHGMQRRWRLWTIALIIGLATAARSVGVALLVPFVIHTWRQSPSPRWFLVRAAWLLPLACWGLATYIVYQAFRFGEPFAFVQTQVHWSHTISQHSLIDRVWQLVTLAPIWSVYDSASPCYWAQFPPRGQPVWSLMFANPIYFCLSVGSIVVGAWKRWLTLEEVALGAAMLLVPYGLQADRACMAAQARYASAVFPMYIVLGNCLERLPPPLAAALTGVSGLMMGFYTAFFVAWYWFY